MPGKKEESKTKVETQLSLPKDTAESKERLTTHQKAGLIFPVGRVLRLMREGRYADHIGKKSAIGVSAVLEYLTAEILEMSGDLCFNAEGGVASKTIKPRHICLAVRGDDEMNRAIGNHVIIPMGGVIPRIHEELEGKGKKSRKDIEEFKDDEAEEDSKGDEETCEENIDDDSDN